MLPDWIVLKAGGGGNKHGGVASTSGSSATTPSSTPQVMKKRKASTMRDYLIPPMTATEQAAFQDEFAMHYFMTATSFYRMEYSEH